MIRAIAPLPACAALLAIASSAAPCRLNAQPVPDASLPTPSIVAPIAPGTYRIGGGTAIDTNLFHSFREFDLGAGEVAAFGLDAAIANAIVRVTGGRASQIDGAIVSDTGANLIFVNPQGWLFGAGAQLDVGGAIAFSSADAVVFADGSVFPSAAIPASESLLSIAVPVGLQLGEAGDIRIAGNGHDLSVADPILAPIERNGATDGLRGAPGNLLALVGGNVTIDGGTVTAASGRLSIVAGRNGFVPLGATIDSADSFDSGVEFGSVTLDNSALVDVTGPVSGRIDLIGDRVRVATGSIALTQQFDDSAPDFPGAGIFVRGARSVVIDGIAANGRLQTRLNAATLQGTRRGGDIVVRTPELTVSQGAAIATRSFGDGRGGDLTVEAGVVQLLDVNDRVPDFFPNLTATSLGTARAGDLTVSTDRLFARDGGAIASSTFGLGDGGNASVTARDRIDLVGVDLRRFSPSVIIASSFGFGDAGDLDVRAPEIRLAAGGRIDASSFNAGAAGTVTVTADRLTVSGTVPGSLNPSTILSSANVLDPELRALLGVPDIPTGASGDVRLFVDRLDVRDGATVTVRNDGTGDGGRLSIVADTARVSDRGSLSAATTSGTGGNISLAVRDSLQLRGSGAISATAGGTGNGGNIDLSAATIVAFENSDITANAIAGRGGNVAIATQGLFGATLRSSLSPESDITASSNFGLAGNVQLQTPELDTSQGAVVLSTQTLDRDTLVRQDCQKLQRGQFTLIGRSGAPIDPLNDVVYSTPVPIASFPAPTLDRRPSRPVADSARGDIALESRGWMQTDSGAIVLTGSDRPAIAPSIGCVRHEPAPPNAQTAG